MANKTTRIWKSFLLFLLLVFLCESRIFSRKYKHKEKTRGENEVQLKHQCDHNCVCQNMKVFCDGKWIKSVPRRLPVNVEYLNLKDNHLRKIRARHLKDLPRLKHLLLKGNSIYHIDNDAFRDLSSLMSLSLTENKIRRLAPDTFKGLYRLQYLSMRTNRLKHVDGLFDPLKSMTLLNLGENRLQKITDVTFRRTSHLRVLDLHNNSISFIARNAFRYLPYLKYLVLRDNPLGELDLDFKLSFHLELLDLTNCSLTEVPKGLPFSINDLRLSENKIRALKSNDFKSARKIRLLVLNKNEIETVPPDAFDRLWQLHDLYIGGNKMKTLPQKLPSSIHGFYANHNNISEIPTGVFGNKESKLEYLYLKNNSIKSISQEAFRALKKVKSIDLSWNRIKNINAFTFSSTRDLEVLDLSNNPLRRVGHDSFYGLTNLHILQMASIISDANASLHPSVFKDTSNLLFLDLSNSSGIVRHLAENPYVLDLLSSLEDLNLMHDNLYSLPATFPQYLPKLKAIKLIGNPWHCDETIYWLTQWIQASKVEFFAKDEMVCASPPKLRGKKISDLHLSILPKVKKPFNVKPYLEPIDLPIHHGDGNFSFILNFTTDQAEGSEEVEQFVETNEPGKPGSNAGTHSGGAHGGNSHGASGHGGGAHGTSGHGGRAHIDATHGGSAYIGATHGGSAHDASRHGGGAHGEVGSAHSASRHGGGRHSSAHSGDSHGEGAQDGSAHDKSTPDVGTHIPTTVTTTKPYKKDSMPDVNNEVLKRKDKDKLKKRKLKNRYVNDQHEKKQKHLKPKKHKSDPYDTKTPSRGRHRIVETEGSGQYRKNSKTRLFEQLLSQEKDHFIKNTDGSGSAESFYSNGHMGNEVRSLDSHVKPGLFYDAYVRTDNQHSGEDYV